MAEMHSLLTTEGNSYIPMYHNYTALKISQYLCEHINCSTFTQHNFPLYLQIAPESCELDVSLFASC